MRIRVPCAQHPVSSSCGSPETCRIPHSRSRRVGRVSQSILKYHQPIMRTTIDLPDHLLVDAKKLAAERHVPLTRLLEESLRAYLSEQRLRTREEPPSLPVLTGPRPVAGVDLDDTSHLWELE